ncbi:MAG: molybdate ABC transporter substrate-binding protein [Gammaproteobacteria bacterium]|nr:molybdate ABC transporter substrate-binding protein [Gammaproteobacteria bacterium]MDH3847662.1 molybdate ABC transporter substrate-binding protein [Gammaproteobacteria bacterium]MDH3906094.1 molybdate ABC transporter substrate-binding protein [Gammaproteobacteria bacterium]MDH4004205.1 molybdate ABC transporter substrate-binding protein [Gammaproteobacteria bacterium]
MILLPVAATGEDYVTVAVASNFAATARDIAARFSQESGFDVRITTASTGKLYAQIVNGAPFDILLAADAERPQRLEAVGAGVPGTRFTYALGALELWSRRVEDCREALRSAGGGLIAIANPETAPYGAAARSYLQRSGLWESLRDRLVIGENIAQTLQFAASGNAQLGFIARSQLRAASLPSASCSWPVPETMHAAIDQQAILLKRGADAAGAKPFLRFLRGDEGRAIILRHGYRLPEVKD